MASEAHDLQELRRSASLATKVFVQRDYSDGTLCQFQTKFPLELDSRLERQLFEETVKTLNGFYAEAEKIGGSSYLEGCLACATAYFIFLCMETHYEKVLKKISKYIQEQNEQVYAPRGLLLTDPVERGMRVIEISIYEDRCSSRSTSSPRQAAAPLPSNQPRNALAHSPSPWPCHSPSPRACLPPSQSDPVAPAWHSPSRGRLTSSDSPTQRPFSCWENPWPHCIKGRSRDPGGWN
ncbi:golgin subfamily A member 7B isoform X1 [Natator depressus]|uniref:golgin subfamily A member 7B isoform X1 n=1 Tax=Natator depressus TaxID=27790 RepID=UPI003EBE0BC1